MARPTVVMRAHWRLRARVTQTVVQLETGSEVASLEGSMPSSAFPSAVWLKRFVPSLVSLEALWLLAPFKPSDVPVEIGSHATKEAKLELAGDSEMGVCILSNDSGRAKAKTEQLPAASPSPKIRSLAPGGRPPFDRRRHTPCPLPLDPASLPSSADARHHLDRLAHPMRWPAHHCAALC